MIITIATNCRPTRQRMSFWLKFGLLPRVRFRRPESQDDEHGHDGQRHQMVKHIFHQRSISVLNSYRGFRRAGANRI